MVEGQVPIGSSFKRCYAESIIKLFQLH